MSIVGPRPLRPGEADTTADGVMLPLSAIPGYEARHRVRPGLTGVAQVYAPRDLPRNGKFRYDLLYLRRAGLWLDLVLILAVVLDHGARPMGTSRPEGLGRCARRLYNRAHMLDVAIIGGGPGGLSAARRLAADGRSVTVFEEHDRIGTPVHCTGVLAEDVIASLDLPREAVLNPLSTVRFVAPAGHSFDYTTATTEAVVIDRETFDTALARRAEAAGATIVRGGARHRASIPHPTASIADARPIGEPRRARAVILACGANYAFQKRLGLGMPSTFLQSAQLELPADRLGDVEIHFGSEIAPEGICVGGAGAAALRHLRAHRRDGRRRCRACIFRGCSTRVRERWAVGGAGRAGAATADAAAGEREADLCGSRAGGGRCGGTGEADDRRRDLLQRRQRRDCGGSAGRRAGGRTICQPSALREYEQRWRGRFQSEFTAQLALRFVAQRMRDADIDALFTLATTDGILPLVRQTARFNRHRDFILALLKHQPARRALVRPPRQLGLAAAEHSPLDQDSTTGSLRRRRAAARRTIPRQPSRMPPRTNRQCRNISGGASDDQFPHAIDQRQRRMPAPDASFSASSRM